jgi:hypothetical protein
VRLQTGTASAAREIPSQPKVFIESKTVTATDNFGQDFGHGDGMFCDGMFCVDATVRPPHHRAMRSDALRVIEAAVLPWRERCSTPRPSPP